MKLPALDARAFQCFPLVQSVALRMTAVAKNQLNHYRCFSVTTAADLLKFGSFVTELCPFFHIILRFVM
jgi:hypothetical protein